MRLFDDLSRGRSESIYKNIYLLQAGTAILLIIRNEIAFDSVIYVENPKVK